MHWVKRGSEPMGLKQIRNTYTDGWVLFYRHNKGERPKDKHWQKFHTNVSKCFSSLCAYCDGLAPKKRTHELC